MNKNICLVDLGFGDSGKGSITDWLCRHHKSSLVVRYNGGAQAAHNVHTADGRHHTFRQFGSGTLAGAKTIIGRDVVINPLTMNREATELEALGITNPLSNVYVDWSALVVTPYHRALNCIRETLRSTKHGSTGMGIGEARRISLGKDNHHSLIVNDFRYSRWMDLEKKLADLRAFIVYEASQLLIEHKPEQAIIDLLQPEFAMLGKDLAWTQPKELAKNYQIWYQKVNVYWTYELIELIDLHSTPVIFEGAQGLLLDKQHGFHPYTTWSDTTPRGAFALLSDASDTEVIGISRTYATRHGVGPLPTEGHLSREMVRDDDNPTGKFEGTMRVGCLDLEMLRYALDVCRRVGHPVDKLAFTHCDKLAQASGVWPVCHSYSNGPDIPLAFYCCEKEASVEAAVFTVKLERAEPEVIQHPTYRVMDDIVGELGIPIAVKSFGKTADDKIKLC